MDYRKVTRIAEMLNDNGIRYKLASYEYGIDYLTFVGTGWTITIDDGERGFLRVSKPWLDSSLKLTQIRDDCNLTFLR